MCFNNIYASYIAIGCHHPLRARLRWCPAAALPLTLVPATLRSHAARSSCLIVRAGDWGAAEYAGVPQPPDGRSGGGLRKAMEDHMGERMLELQRKLVVAESKLQARWWQRVDSLGLQRAAESRLRCQHPRAASTRERPAPMSGQHPRPARWHHRPPDPHSLSASARRRWHRTAWRRPNGE